MKTVRRLVFANVMGVFQKQKQVEIERSLALLKKAREQKQKIQKMKGLGAAPRTDGASMSPEQRKPTTVHRVVEKGDKVTVGESTFDETTTGAPMAVPTKLKLQPRQHSPSVSSKVPKLKLHIGVGFYIRNERTFVFIQAKASGKHLKHRQLSAKQKRSETVPTETTKAKPQTSVKHPSAIITSGAQSHNAFAEEERPPSYGVVDESMPSIHRSRVEYMNSLTESKGRYWMRKDVRNAYRKKVGTRASSPPKLLGDL